MTDGSRDDPGALDGVRILDLAGPFGNYAGKLFADLGADVVLVEHDVGTESRLRDPLTAEGESVWFTYHNANKRAALVQPGSSDLFDLLSRAQVVIGSGAARWPQAWGLDLAALRKDLPDLVVISVTPFGLTGPYAEWDGTDLIAQALGGLLALGGYGDGAPTRAACEQAVAGAQLFAAVGGMMSILHQESGEGGQIVDVSIQETAAVALEHALQYYELEGSVRKRQIGRVRGAGAGLYPCADGWIYLFVGGIASGRFWTRFVEWLVDEGAEGVDELQTPAWEERAFFDTPAAKETFGRIFERFSAMRTKEALYHSAQARGIALAPVRAPSEVVASEQLLLRDFFQELVTPSGRAILAPGAPFVLSETPWRQRRPAPGLGEHTVAILEEWGGQP